MMVWCIGSTCCSNTSGAANSASHELSRSGCTHVSRCKHLVAKPCVVIRSGEAHNIPKHARACLAHGYAVLTTAHKEAIVPCLLVGRLRRGAVQNRGRPAERSQPAAPQLVATRDVVRGAGNEDESIEVVWQLMRQRRGVVGPIPCEVSRADSVDRGKRACQGNRIRLSELLTRCERMDGCRI
eukprot:scaffold27109_cov62-Phaeocystis_antarctica.AAC.2